jgi:hypothetical protein
MELLPLKSLRVLFLSKTQLDDAGLKEVANFKNMRQLELTETTLNDAGLKGLRRQVVRRRAVDRRVGCVYPRVSRITSWSSP